MNAKHRKTLKTLFSTPTPRTLAFRELEGLLRALGCSVEEGPGSAIGFFKDGKHLGMHRPHPGKEIKIYQVKEARDFLRDLGVEP